MCDEGIRATRSRRDTRWRSIGQIERYLPTDDVVKYAASLTGVGA